MLGIVNTLIENLKARDVELFAHTPDRETMKLLDLPNRVTDFYKEIVEDVIPAKDALEVLELMIESNRQFMEENPDTEPPEKYYMGINWDKLPKIGVDEDYKIQEKFKSLLQQAGILNVHVITVVRDSTQFYQFATLYSHRIVGKSMEKESLKWLDSNKAQLISEMFAFYVYGSTIEKFKIYKFPLYGEILSREVKL